MSFYFCIVKIVKEDSNMATTTMVSILILIAFGDIIASSLSDRQQQREIKNDETNY